MSDPCTRAENGDTGYFKRTPVKVWAYKDGADGDSVLHLSIKKKHLHCTKVIYERCPDLLYQPSVMFGFSPLHYAALVDDKPSIMKFLISVADTRLYRMKDDSQNTPLHLAIANGRIEAVELLIEADPDHLSLADATRGTPLSSALQVSHKRRYDNISVKIRQLILEKQPEASKIRSWNGWSALHQATWNGDIGGIEDIILLCPDSVRIVDKYGRDFIDTAADYNHSDMVSQILQKKEVWNSILKGNNNNQVLQKLEFSKFRGQIRLHVPDTMLTLYRALANKYGDIVEPSSKHMHDDQDSTPVYQALGCFLADVSEMLHVKTSDVSLEKISNWEKKAAQYTAMGLQVSWFHQLVARYRNWLAEKGKYLNHLDNEIKTKCEGYDKKRIELRSLQHELAELGTEINTLKEQRDTYTCDDPLLEIRRVTGE